MNDRNEKNGGSTAPVVNMWRAQEHQPERTVLGGAQAARSGTASEDSPAARQTGRVWGAG